MQELIRMENICVDNVLSHARFSVMKGEISGILGLNNTGKTELVSIIAGRLKPERGIVYFEDQPITLSSPAQANALGIYYIHTEQQLLENFTVAENILLLKKRHRHGLYNSKSITAQCHQLLGILLTEETGIFLNADDYLRDLNLLQRLAVQIIKAINEDAKLIIIDHYLDELPGHWMKSLEKWLRLLTQNLSLSIIVTAYKANSLSGLCDRVFVLRRGICAGSFEPNTYDDSTLTAAMTGNLMKGKILEHDGIGKPSIPGKKTVLQFDYLHIPGYKKGLCIDLLEDETVGLCCISDQFIQNLCGALIGAVPIQEGQIFMDSMPVQITSADTASDYGIGIVFEHAGLFPNLSFKENVSVLALRKFSSCAGIINNSATTLAISEALSLWNQPFLIPEKVHGINHYTEKKILISRAMSILPRVMIYQNLPKGLDDIAYDRIIKRISEMPIQPKASLFISSNIQSLIKVCTKIYFVHDGAAVSKIYPSKMNLDEMLSYYRNFCGL